MPQNRAIMAEIQHIISEGEALDIKTRDRLLLTAIIDIYTQLDAMQDQLNAMAPAMTFYRVGLFFATLLGASAVALMWGILTHTVTLTFR